MGIGSLLAFREYWGIIRELSFSRLADEAQERPRLLVVAEAEERAHDLARALFGNAGERFVDAERFDAAIDPLRYDAIVAVGGLPSQVLRDWNRLFKRAREEARIVDVQVRVVGDGRAEEAARQRLVDRVADDRVLALGRFIPALRTACSHRVVWDTSVADGQFALISNVPEVVPVIGNLIAAGADFLVLTKNQLLMLYKLAAIFDRNLDNRRRIYSEMIPVVGAGLVWRTVARELVTMAPFGLGTVPKVAIAFAGTYAVGRAATVYFGQGEKLSSEQMKSLYAEALDLLKGLNLGRGAERHPPLPDGKDRDAAD